MEIRRILLRAMLWSLALAAVTGVLAVLVAAGDLVWRVTGTGIVTAVACAVMIPVSGLIDRKRAHTAGLLGMLIIVAEYVLALALIWDLAAVLFVRGEEKFAGTMFLLAIAGTVLAWLTRLLHVPGGHLAARVGIVLTSTVMVLFMIAIWSMTPGITRLEWWETAWALSVADVLVTLNLFQQRENFRWIRRMGASAGVLAVTLWLGDIWIGAGSDPGFVIFVVSISAGAVTAAANLAALCPLSPGQFWVRTVTIVALIAVAVLVDLIAIDAEAYPLGIPDEFMVRATSASGIVAGCGSLALCVLARINRRVDFELETGQFTSVAIVCPHCRKKQKLPTGDARCASCGLRISIHIQDPRCPQCDYLLIGHTSDQCPECGTPIDRATSV